ncbi:hypothetical protein LTR62_004210 [Meristemomyces frigidus]|uniref:Carboxylic ester hydrolase n=1 Tax=Meristemomyces frigidus TaxID=1508187 RepID=A0AAN7YRG0_9PEZI|nr:hypothetical protein LTR62_004210 [Meristemomyces frigidus]
MQKTLLSLLALTTTLHALPLEERAAAPTVKIQNGTIIGSTTLGVDNFKGIPFAEPPTGTNRLRPPQTISASFGTITATANAPACPQFLSQTDTSSLPSNVLGELGNSPLFQTVTSESEDCLFLNVQRPAGTSSDAQLPVLFWIFGGGFETGSAGMYDGSNFVTKSVSLKAPVIYVSVAYRVSGFGFLAGKQLSAEGSTNLGLRDQRLGLQWVADNIGAFGGDPKKVTIWGESAGSISVFDQTVINGGDNTYHGQALFRGAIMDSGSVTPADPVTAPQAQAVFNTVAQNAGCGGNSNVLACLRAAPYQTFLDATTSVPGIFSYRSLDLSYLPRPDPHDNFFSVSPEVSLLNGNYAKVPIIIGDQQDEGTLFSLVLSNITTDAQFNDYLTSYFPGNPNAKADVTGLLAQYPDQPLLGQPAGSPFDTGALNNIYPQYKRIAAVLGDIVFTITRRTYLHNVAQKVPAWSYLNTYFHGTPVLGTFHGSDILVAYGDGPLELALDAQTVQQYYIAFVNHLDPNALGTASPLIEWPQWSNASGSPQLVDFAATGLSTIPDTFRSNVYDYLVNRVSEFRV